MKKLGYFIVTNPEKGTQLKCDNKSFLTKPQSLF